MTNQQHYRTISFVKQVTIAVLLLIVPCVFGSEPGGDRVVAKLSDPSRPATIHAHLVNGSITVKGYDGNDVIVEARGRGRDSSEDSEAPKGLHRIPQTATGLSVDSENNEVNVKVEDFRSSVDLMITAPRHTSVSLHSVNNGNIVVSDIDGELDINNVNGAVTLNHVSGSVVAHALNGRVLATLSHVDPQKPLAFSSMNGDIDVTFPPDIKANLSLRTDNGEIYSDFDIQLQPNMPQQTVEDDEDEHDSGQGRDHPRVHRHRVRIDKTLHATLNGGGPEIQIKDFNGNIYIRKAGK